MGCQRAPDRTDWSDLLVLEYEQLKEEQRLRIASRDNLIYATLVAVGAVAAAAMQVGSPSVLLILAPVCAVLGWTHAANDRKVSEIGRHIGRTLAVQLAASTTSPVDVFSWESAHRRTRSYRTQQVIQIVVTLLTFCGPPLAAVVVNCCTAFKSPIILCIALAEVAATALLCCQILTNVDSRPDLVGSTSDSVDPHA